MYKSFYNYTTLYSESHWILANFRRGGIVLLTPEEFVAYNNSDEISAGHPLFDGLKDDFLVNSVSEERLSVSSARREYAFSDSSYYRILTTTSCNASCKYCYERKFPKETMTDATAKRVAEFILHASRTDTKTRIHWFGGEPLVNARVIDLISNEIRDLPFTSLITTNGYLLSKRTLERAINNWKLDTVQISLDGFGAAHNEIKQFGDDDAFFKIVENVKYALEQSLTVNLRLNYSSDELSKFEALATWLGSNLPPSNRLIVEAAPIFRVFDIDRPEGFPERLECSLVKANEILISNGLKTPVGCWTLTPRVGQCYACQSNGLVISPSGSLFKCGLYCHKQSDNVGSVFSGIDKNRTFRRWVNPNLPDKCNQCVFLPICQGGCRAGYFGRIDYCCHRAISEIDSFLKRRVECSLDGYPQLCH